MKICRKLKTNWWLWMSFSIPPIVYSWVRLRDVKGAMISYWGYLSDYLHRTGYNVTQEIWSIFVETLIWSALPPLLIGWIAQYLIMLVREEWRDRVRRVAT
jgi:hypothetical protein